LGNYINWKCKIESETNLEIEEAERSSTDDSDDKEEVEKGKKEEYANSDCISAFMLAFWATVTEFNCWS
jgi:hypothetical protein